MNKKILALAIIIIFIGVDASQVTAKFQIENRSELLKDTINSVDELFFDLKVKILMKICHMPSLSVCIVKNDTVVYYKGYGFSKLNTREKPTIDTVYPVASITKTVTGTAMMQLYEQGKYDLDDDVNNYLDFT